MSAFFFVDGPCPSFSDSSTRFVVISYRGELTKIAKISWELIEVLISLWNARPPPDSVG